MSRSTTSPVDPVLAGMIGAAVVIGGGLVAYGTSQPTDGEAAPAPVVQRDDAVTARALAAVEGLASAGEDGTPSAPAAARRAAQASLRGRAVDPFRAGAKAAGAARSGATATGTDAAATDAAASGASTSADGQARDAAADTSASAASAGSAEPAEAAGSAAAGSGAGAASSGSAGTGSSGSGGTSSSGSAGTTSPGSAATGPSASGSGGSASSGGTTAVGGGTPVDDAEVARRLAAAARADAARRLRLEAERLAKAPARVSLRVATPNGKRARNRLAVGTLLPNRADAVARVLRVARSNRVVTLRLRDGARLSGPQSPGTRCVLRVEATGQCRLVHVRAGKAAVIQAADVDGAPGPITAVRVLSVWRGDTRVFGG